ncbi:Hsp70 family protein [Brevundimonas sp.]|uniref:Hsp70 family protein n=1 Tax=Brevundimonas sp. TaxID=1871086 RepID=UPI002899CD4B|nr:Hsp70 family protein [Brevundimonas sp.]
MTTPSPITIGIDFGTTNTVVAVTDAQGRAQLTTFGAAGATFRSALAFQFHPSQDGQPPERVIEAGPWAVETYVEDPLETRFIQSFKTFAASAAFTETRIDDRRYRFEDLLSAFLLRLRHHAGEHLSDLPARVVVGRPVTFAGNNPDEALALSRYQTAFGRLGFTDIRYAHEPVGAAFYFARQLKEDATVLVADFGGGTSDFSIIRFEQDDGVRRSIPLARSGVGVAGDAFDYRIIDNLVSPALGKGGLYRALDKQLPIPQRYYSAFARWDQLALLRASRDMRDIRALARTALEPEKIERLIEILDDNHGHALYRAVSALKTALSSQKTATFDFAAGDVRIVREVARVEFEGWIAPELSAIAQAVDRAMVQSDLPPEGIDRVFLTGGTSFVPAVRALFHQRFGPEKIETGGEFESIAAGLALIGLEPQLDLWSEKAA